MLVGKIWILIKDKEICLVNKDSFEYVSMYNLKIDTLWNIIWMNELNLTSYNWIALSIIMDN